MASNLALASHESLKFPKVDYLSHDFTLTNHPLCVDLLCVAHDEAPVTNESVDKWLLARRLGVTASGFGELITAGGARSKGRERAVRSKVLGLRKDMSFVPAIKLGLKYEAMISDRVEKMYGVEANQWLVAQDETPRFLATPDGLSTDLVAEYKTSVKSWGVNLQSYYRQIQWQLFVTDREESVFAVMHPKTKNLMAGIVPRDDEEIALLKIVAAQVLAEMDAYGRSDDFLKHRKA